MEVADWLSQHGGQVSNYAIIDDDSDIFPLTLLVDNTMRDGVLVLAVPTLDDGDETEIVTVDVPQYEYA